MTAEFGTCPRCREVVHDSDCTLVGDGRPAEDGPRAWAGACVHCRRAIQSDDPAGPWVDAFGRSECLATTDRHQPEVPGELDDVRTDQPGWVKRQTSAGWTVPEGWRFENLGQCRTCYTDVAWCWTPAGNRAPVEKDGVPHFARCPQASQHRRRK